MNWIEIVNSHVIKTEAIAHQSLKTWNFPRAFLRYNSVYSDSSNLPNMKFSNFVGNSLEWPDWSSMFIATVNQQLIPDPKRKILLRTLLTGKLKSTVSGMAYFGNLSGLTWSYTEGNSWRSKVIIDPQATQLELSFFSGIRACMISTKQWRSNACFTYFWANDNPLKVLKSTSTERMDVPRRTQDTQSTAR